MEKESNPFLVLTMVTTSKRSDNQGCISLGSQRDQPLEARQTLFLSTPIVLREVHVPQRGHGTVFHIGKGGSAELHLECQASVRRRLRVGGKTCCPGPSRSPEGAEQVLTATLLA